LDGAVHEALKIAAAMFAGEKDVSHGQSLDSRYRSPLPSPVDRVAAFRVRMRRPMEFPSRTRKRSVSIGEYLHDRGKTTMRGHKSRIACEFRALGAAGEDR